MDRHFEKEKSSRKNRDERERDRDHGDCDRDRKHRSSKDDQVRESEEKSKRKDKHSSKDDKHRDGDRDHQSRNYSETQLEKSNELPNAREGSRDDGGLREESVEERSSPSRSSHKRKHRSESEERSLDKSEKRSMGLKEEKGKKRHFGDKALEKRRDGRRIENDNKEHTRVANDVTCREERIEMRRFGNRPKEENLRDFEEEKQRGLEFFYNWKKILVLKDHATNFIANIPEPLTLKARDKVKPDLGVEPLNMKSCGKTSSAHNHQSHPTKVSYISTINENKGVNFTMSHEVPEKSSTDGKTISAAGKSECLSLDAMAKAKKALQMQKELSEKLKKISTDKLIILSFNICIGKNTSKGLNKVSASKTNGTRLMELNKQVSGPSSLNIGTQRGPQSLNIGVPNIEAIKRSRELAAKMGFHDDPEFALIIINMFPGQMSADVTITQKPAKAPVLRIDAHGREVDEHGNIINLPKLTNISTLKVNINKQKDAFQKLIPELDVDSDPNPRFDSDMGIKIAKLLRPKRMSYQFVEEGKWSKDGEIIKFKSQFLEAQAKELKIKQAQLAKAKAELDINPNLIKDGESYNQRKT
ncbi:hypothetical protein GIB67_025762 [Kingdonia uniflora]|uniref:Uncharacterized protein n=1 Tax=Kingdonia uniflora TaxID=39325 RepID=A0A7J7L303_9MAGN|nr:hypothetical protein GIB67_025762 [Kingdonia uniflora]